MYLRATSLSLNGEGKLEDIHRPGGQGSRGAGKMTAARRTEEGRHEREGPQAGA